MTCRAQFFGDDLAPGRCPGSLGGIVAYRGTRWLLVVVTHRRCVAVKRCSGFWENWWLMGDVVSHWEMW